MHKYICTIIIAQALLGCGGSSGDELDEQEPSAELGNATLGVGSTGEMRIAYFDREIARQNGYEIRTDELGEEYSVPIDPKLLLDKSTNGARRNGGCGSSWVKVNGTGNRGIRLETSFNVIATVVAFEWHISLIDWGGVSTQNWGPRPGPFSSNWSSKRDLPNMTRGPVSAMVLPNSIVFLANGGVCRSLSPQDFGNIY